MKKIMSILLSIVMSTSLVIPTFAEAPPYSIDKVATKVVIDQHELRDIYDKYASVTDETVVEDMLMEDFGFSRSEVKELLEVSKRRRGHGPRRQARRQGLPRLRHGGRRRARRGHHLGGHDDSAQV